jgi:hypothetical protein
MSHSHEDVLELPGVRLEGESVEVSQEASASRRKRESIEHSSYLCCIIYLRNHVKLKVDQCRHAIPPNC